MKPSLATIPDKLSKQRGASSHASVMDFILSGVKHRSLLRHLVSREVLGRYRGSMFGVLWSFLNPLVMLAVYTVVFGSVFKSRWGQGEENVAQFALVLFAGMIVFNLFSECVGRAPSLITSNANYVKKVVFPLEILPWVSLGAACFHAAISLAVLVLFNLVINHSVNWTIIVFPLVLIPLAFMIVGVSWFLAALGAYLRDIGQVIGLAMSVLMFLSPLFYPVTAIPERFRTFMYLNPLTFIIEQSRNVLLYGRQPDWGGLALYSVGAVVVAYCGFVFFQKAKKGFADVL
jgi:lipopolysaccharide transport system permease protein